MKRDKVVEAVQVRENVAQTKGMNELDIQWCFDGIDLDIGTWAVIKM